MYYHTALLLFPHSWPYCSAWGNETREKGGRGKGKKAWLNLLPKSCQSHLLAVETSPGGMLTDAIATNWLDGVKAWTPQNWKNGSASKLIRECMWYLSWEKKQQQGESMSSSEKSEAGESVQLHCVVVTLQCLIFKMRFNGGGGVKPLWLK